MAVEQLEADFERTSLANRTRRIVWGGRRRSCRGASACCRRPPASSRRWLWTARLAERGSCSPIAHCIRGSASSLTDSAVNSYAYPALTWTLGTDSRVTAKRRWLARGVAAARRSTGGGGLGLSVTSQRRASRHEAAHAVLAVNVAERRSPDCPTRCITCSISRPFAWESSRLEEGEGRSLMAAATLVASSLDARCWRHGQAAPPTLSELMIRRDTRPAMARRSRHTAGAAGGQWRSLLLTTYATSIEGDGWGPVRPVTYTGPVSLVEQRSARPTTTSAHRRLGLRRRRSRGAAEIFARLTPEGSDRPVRESRAEVRGARFSNATAAFHFAPIPDSGGTLYTLAVGVLSGPRPTCSLA